MAKKGQATVKVKSHKIRKVGHNSSIVQGYKQSNDDERMTDKHREEAINHMNTCPECQGKE